MKTAKLDHWPANPPRKGHVGEQVFARSWAVLTAQVIHQDTDDQHPLHDILPWNPTQQDAHTAAAIVCWFGTNVGQAFLGLVDKFRDLHAKGVQSLAAYDQTVPPGLVVPALMVWATQNTRRAGINNGKDHLDCVLFPTTERSLSDAPTTRDYRVAEWLMRWLETKSGREFIHVTRLALHNAERGVRGVKDGLHALGLSGIPVSDLLDSNVAIT